MQSCNAAAFLFAFFSRCAIIDNRIMKIFAPKYYNNFKCVAGACKHTCCALWEMPVDNDAINFYRNLSKENAEWVLSKITGGDEPRFCFGNARRCAFLRDDGLCEMIIRLGEKSLCSVCKEHPRFYNLLAYRCEAGLGLCCEEAVRVALFSDNDEMVEIGCDDEPTLLPDEIEKRAIELRAEAFALLEGDGKLNGTIEEMENHFGVPKKSSKLREMLSVYYSLEELESGFHELLKNIELDGNIKSGYELELKRLLKYFIYRHATLAESDYDFAVRLGFCTLSVRIIDALSRGKDKEGFIEVVRRYCAEIEYSDDNTVTLLEEIAW